MRRHSGRRRLIRVGRPFLLGGLDEILHMWGNVQWIRRDGLCGEVEDLFWEGRADRKKERRSGVFEILYSGMDGKCRTAYADTMASRPSLVSHSRDER